MTFSYYRHRLLFCIWISHCLLVTIHRVFNSSFAKSINRSVHSYLTPDITPNLHHTLTLPYPSGEVPDITPNIHPTLPLPYPYPSDLSPDIKPYPTPYTTLLLPPDLTPDIKPNPHPTLHPTLPLPYHQI